MLLEYMREIKSKLQQLESQPPKTEPGTLEIGEALLESRFITYAGGRRGGAGLASYPEC
jgi:hypothetical protein